MWGYKLQLVRQSYGISHGAERTKCLHEGLNGKITGAIFPESQITFMVTVPWTPKEKQNVTSKPENSSTIKDSTTESEYL